MLENWHLLDDYKATVSLDQDKRQTPCMCFLNKSYNFGDSAVGGIVIPGWSNDSVSSPWSTLTCVRLDHGA